MIGSATLPSTRLWPVTVWVGEELCTQLSHTLLVECLNEFIDQRGQFLCPDGYVNVQGPVPCRAAA
jgi:hypothetical protein